MTTRRQERVAELLQRELAEMIAFDLRDPRLAFVSVTRVQVSPDLRYARIFVSHLGDDESRRHILPTLQGASGFLRRELGRRTDLRYLPELQFLYDEGLEAAQHMDALLDAIVASDDATPDPDGASPE